MKKDISVGEIVAKDFRTAVVFKEAGIDFCCGGKKTLEDACVEKNADVAILLEKLGKLESTPQKAGQNFNDWEPGFLCDYIVNIHHKYILQTMPDLVQYTAKLASVHGSHHPELTEVAELFAQVSKELTQHLKKEEEVLFPAIKDLMRTGSVGSVDVINSEIERLTDEHEFAGGAMDKINEITNHYKVPDDGCNTYRVGFHLLEEFENDLHIHVHLENNVLFPKIFNRVK